MSFARKIYLGLYFATAIVPLIVAVQALAAYLTSGIALSLVVIAAALTLAAVLLVSFSQIYKSKTKSVWITVSRIIIILCSLAAIILAVGSLIFFGPEIFATYWLILRIGFSAPEIIAVACFPLFALPTAVLSFFVNRSDIALNSTRAESLSVYG